MPWIRKPAGPSYVTSLPSNPVDGQEIYYAADATNGVIWHLRYRGSSSSSYKWEFVGGQELRNLGNAEVGPKTLPSPAAWFDISSAFSVTVPLAGDYVFKATSCYYGPPADLYLGVATSASGSPAASTQSNHGDGYEPLAFNGLLTEVSASAALTLRFYSSSTSGAAYRRLTSLLVTPVRVG